LFDVTAEESISSIKANLPSGGNDLIPKLQNNLRDFFGNKDLLLGYSFYNKTKTNHCESVSKKSNSIILSDSENIQCDTNFFCANVMHKFLMRKSLL